MKILVLLLYFWVHDFHNSLTEIRYNTKSKSLEISMRVFSDDFELALTKANKGKKITLNEKDAILNPLVESYISRHFYLKSSREELSMDYIGKEIEEDAVWLAFEIKNCGSLVNHTITNSVFSDLYSDQTNVVNIIYPNQNKTFVFSKNKFSEIWPF
ncbi:MAG: DUF6702 family protein [Leadbetterella sp.]